MKCEKCKSESKERQSMSECQLYDNHFIDSEEFSSMSEALRHIYNVYGTDIFLNTNRLFALMCDFAPRLEKERRLIKICGEAGVINEMINAGESDNFWKENIVRKSVNKLESAFMINEDWAKKGLEWLGLAFGWPLDLFRERIDFGEVADYVIDGGKYTGMLEKGKPQGEGVFVFDCGHVYRGGFANGKFSGDGEITWKHGVYKNALWSDSWSGVWKNGEPWEGCGTYVFHDYQTVTTVPFLNGKANGSGRVFEKCGRTYSGDMKDGQYCGLNGCLEESDGNVKIGEFRKNELYFGFEFNSENKLSACFREGIKKEV